MCALANNRDYQKSPALSTNERGFWIAFTRIPTLGAVQLMRLRKHFGKMSAAWAADERQLQLAGVLPQTARAIIETRPMLSPERECERVVSAGITAMTIDDPEYPPLLKEIHDPPAILYVRGRLPERHAISVAVVGTRKSTSYGTDAAKRLTSELCVEGFIIVSGLAHGIDTVAHRSALEAGGRTIAVLGSGVDLVYPPSNDQLGRAIVNSGGALVSEYPLGTQAQKHHFPLRNRIIAGLVRGVLVVEGDKDSGSLITARLALESGREVLAVPGDIFRSGSQGPNGLIAMGAKLVAHIDDILDALSVVRSEKRDRQVDNTASIGNNQQSTQMNAEERIIMDLVTRESLHVDEIVKISTLPTSVVNATLAVLEVRGLVRNLGGMRYARSI